MANGYSKDVVSGPMWTNIGALRSDLMRKLAYLFWLTLLCVVGNACAATERYRYRLEDGAQNEVCRHMTQVFNERFKTPWDKGWLRLEPVPKILGTPYDQVFERLPGVEYNKRFVFDMLLAKYPTSPEFEAVKWRETRVMGDNTASPALVAQLDIDNDGHVDWVVKSSFMDKMTTWEGMGQAYGGKDHLRIFSFDAFDPVVPLLSKQLLQGQKPDRPPRNIDDNISNALDTSQLRPFIFHEKTYLSAYQVFWSNLELSKKLGQSTGNKPDKLYPDREYMNILAVLPGGTNRYDYRTYVHSNTEAVCRIRMIMQK